MRHTIQDDTFDKYLGIYQKRIDRAIEYRKFTNTSLAEKLGVSKNAVSSYRTGRAFPSFAMAIRLSLALGVSMDWLIGRGTPGKASENGSWIREESGLHHCSKCGHRIGSYIEGKYYCERCGARNLSEL